MPKTSNHLPVLESQVERSPRPFVYHWRVRRWAARHPGRSWLSEDFVRSLERGPKRRGITSVPRFKFERSEPRAEASKTAPNHRQ